MAATQSHEYRDGQACYNEGRDIWQSPHRAFTPTDALWVAGWVAAECAAIANEARSLA